MLNFKAQSQLADATASILRAQLRASSDTLAASLQGWSMCAQVLATRPATDENPMPAHCQWPWHPGVAWSMWPSWSMWPWSMFWPIGPTKGPLLAPWQWAGCDGATRLGFVSLGPIWWAAGGRWLRAARDPPGKGQVGRHVRLSQPIPVPALAAHAEAGPGSNPGDRWGPNSLDASFARYRSAGGHALAQVVVPPTEHATEATARAWLTPLDVMLGVWRATLGV